MFSAPARSFDERCPLPVWALVPVSSSFHPLISPLCFLALVCLWHGSAGGWGQTLPIGNCEEECHILAAYVHIAYIPEGAEVFSGMLWWIVQLGWPFWDHVPHRMILPDWNFAGETGTAYLFLPLWNIPVQQRQRKGGKADSGTDMLCVVASSSRQQGFQKPTVFISVRSCMYPLACLCDQQKEFEGGGAYGSWFE